jgi:hypothetical protein
MAGVAGIAVQSPIQLSRVGDVRLTLENSYLLLVGLSALHSDLRSSSASAFTGRIVRVMGVVLASAARDAAVAAA